MVGACNAIFKGLRVVVEGYGTRVLACLEDSAWNWYSIGEEFEDAGRIVIYAFPKVFCIAWVGDGDHSGSWKRPCPRNSGGSFEKRANPTSGNWKEERILSASSKVRDW
jgi:hypothetical protein